MIPIFYCNYLLSLSIHVNFGKGRIGVSCSVKDFSVVDGGLLPFTCFEVLKEPANIGDDLINAKEDPVNHDYPEIHLNFTDEKSIDIVIKTLKNTKKFLKKIKAENNEQ
jgi:hypothetical protein